MLSHYHTEVRLACRVQLDGEVSTSYVDFVMQALNSNEDKSRLRRPRANRQNSVISSMAMLRALQNAQVLRARREGGGESSIPI